MQNDVAADIEAALSGPLEALTSRVDKVEASEQADAKQLAEQQQNLWAVDRTVVLAERNWHLIAQSLSEVGVLQHLSLHSQRFLCPVRQCELCLSRIRTADIVLVWILSSAVSASLPTCGL